MNLTDLPSVIGVIRVNGRSESVIVDMQSFRRFIRKLKLRGKIDEAVYIEQYPDVSDAIADGKAESATDHYIRIGFFQQRDVTIAE